MGRWKERGKWEGDDMTYTCMPYLVLYNNIAPSLLR